MLTDRWNEPVSRAVFLALAGAISLVLVGIAASQILLAAALVGAVWLWRREGRSRLTSWPFVPPLLCFVVWTVITALTAHNVFLGLRNSKKFFLYLILLLVPFLARGKKDVVTIYRAIFLFAAVNALDGLRQYAMNPHRGELNRISGFMSHWMTFAGLLMLVLVALAAYAICWHRRIVLWWVIPLGAFLGTALVLSETRSAWAGCAAGISTVVLLRRPRAIIPFLVLLVAIFLMLPSSLKHRFQAGWNPNDDNTRNRIELFETSLRLIRAHPWLGVGPDNVKHEALSYRGQNEWPDWMYQHTHNNFTQIAAERGIPGLLLWLWLILRLGWDAMKLFLAERKDSGQTGAGLMIATAALGAWVALLVAGLFEWNFGDSEVLTVFLFMMAGPYTVRSAEQPSPATSVASV